MLCRIFVKNKLVITMNILIKVAFALVISLISYSLEAQDNYSIKVIVVEADNDDGKIFIAVYNSEKHFLEKMFKGTKSKITNNTCTVTFENIPSGMYAVSIFHDENDNGKMDKNFMGIPKEDYGCSNDASGFMGPPKWKDAKFELKADKTITITL